MSRMPAWPRSLAVSAGRRGPPRERRLKDAASQSWQPPPPRPRRRCDHRRLGGRRGRCCHGGHVERQPVALIVGDEQQQSRVWCHRQADPQLPAYGFKRVELNRVEFTIGGRGHLLRGRPFQRCGQRRISGGCPHRGLARCQPFFWTASHRSSAAPGPPTARCSDRVQPRWSARPRAVGHLFETEGDARHCQRVAGSPGLARGRRNLPTASTPPASPTAHLRSAPA